MNIKLISGLGNNFPKYIYNRHNIGLIYIEKLVFFFKKNIFKIEKKKFGKIFYLNVKNNIIHIFISNSYMNLIGKNIKLVLDYLSIINYSNILIAYDEMNLIQGRSKIKFNKINSSHNGIKSIINNINNNKFYRIEIGIGKSINNTHNYLLTNFNINEKNKIYKSIEECILATDILINKGFIKSSKFLNN
ncbi:peptidyl-tRNA hydrolase [endosymbiont of Sipalinus gigas]|uniref:aminoacyl-tRNA hydrolase n=1 Tax=endosymbiont of Sipalinus gigas TaxID=1972134 RepID=UPI000DC6DEA9|nr:aminoacyl-tRNA hydrolase [endosymbiont of Sipalinus gigas]BBA85208.1 peptidyl-tRNA hydrolase [endosymbiont of Sipalinus gigas]